MTISLCLIHGWAVNADIFTEFRHMLPENWRISAPHLIGHGSNHESFSVFEAADKIATQLIEPSFLFGWSLGGLVALHVAACYPERVRGLILSNTFARFQAASDYPQGVSLTSLERMVSFFQQDYTQSVRQFLELQLLHTPQRHEILAAVLPDVAQHGTPAALQSALQAVAQADARAMLPEIQCPALLLYGGKDAITPPRMGEYLAAHLSDATFKIAPQAAHAPFLSHADWCVAQITEWVGEQEKMANPAKG